MDNKRIPIVSTLSRRALALMALAMALVLLLACAPQPGDMNPVTPEDAAVDVEPTMTEQPAANVEPTTAAEPEESSVIVFTLVTVAEGGLFYKGQGGDIDGIVNPTLEVAVGDLVEIILVSGDGNRHDIVAPDLAIKSSMVTDLGAETSVIWEATEAGEFAYWCSVPGHRAAGMEGLIVIND